MDGKEGLARHLSVLTPSPHLRSVMCNPRTTLLGRKSQNTGEFCQSFLTFGTVTWNVMGVYAMFWVTFVGSPETLMEFQEG